MFPQSTHPSVDVWSLLDAKHGYVHPAASYVQPKHPCTAEKPVVTGATPVIQGSCRTYRNAQNNPHSADVPFLFPKPRGFRRAFRFRLCSLQRHRLRQPDYPASSAPLTAVQRGPLPRGHGAINSPHSSEAHCRRFQMRIAVETRNGKRAWTRVVEAHVHYRGEGH